MAEGPTIREQVEEFVMQAQDDILAASRRLAEAITKETARVVPPAGSDAARIVNDVFDFATRVIEGQRKMVSDVIRTMGDATTRAGKGPAPAKAPAAKAPAKKAPAKKAPAKKAPAKKAPAKKAPAKKAPAKKAAAKKA